MRERARDGNLRATNAYAGAWSKRRSKRSRARWPPLVCEIKGIGPWTAAVILLRGLGRLDVFSAKDSGVARSLRVLTGDPIDVAATLAALAPEQGLLYYYLLLARLEARGDIART